MVSDRDSHRERQLRPGENCYPKGEGTDPEPSGGLMSAWKRHGVQKLFIAAVLGTAVSLCLSAGAIAQAIYAENQIPARGVDIAYAVTIKNPSSHLYDVQMSIKGIREASVSVSMPAWSPGMYRIENYARNVQDFRATNSRNQALKWEKTDKQTWHVTKANADDLVVHYHVYSPALADDMADVAPPTVFMYVVGQ